MIAGLRGRLLLAMVLSSAITLSVAGIVVVLGPLQDRLRSQSRDNLENAVLAARPGFERALREKGNARLLEVQDEAIALRPRTGGARILVGTAALARPRPENPDADIEHGFVYDTDLGAPTSEATLVALRAMRERQTLASVRGDDITIAVRLFGRGRGLSGVVVAQRRLTEVTTAVEQVRNALLVAGVVGLLVSLALAVGVSSTLLRRLDRLRRAALRITAEGPDVAAPRDERRDEVGDLANAFASMQDELRRQEAARRAFVATASHELRTPLTMLQGTMELLEEDLGDGRVDISDAQVQVANARRELRRLANLASELLDLSRLDAAVSLRSEPVELRELARAVAAEFELAARERGVTLDVESLPEPCWALGDPDAIARVVRILLDNALRYGPDGQPVRLVVEQAGRETRIEVADRGGGIPSDERERIFERFHRGRAGDSEGGFGLGLAIGRGLAERMGGTLRLHDPAAPGARFLLTLPAADGSRRRAEALTGGAAPRP